MRTVLLGLLLSVSLLAGDRDPLAQSVEQWRSPNAAARNAGSQLAERELRRLLAPLLKAMDDTDPEVRRRARHAVLALVPGEIERLQAAFVRENDAARRQPRAGWQLNVNAAQQARVRALLIRGLQIQRHKVAQRLRQSPDARAAAAIDEQMGITVRTTRQTPPFAVGVRVMRTRKAKRGEKLGLRRGDVIVKVGAKRVGTPEELTRALGGRPDWKKVRLTVVRVSPAGPTTIVLP